MSLWIFGRRRKAGERDDTRDTAIAEWQCTSCRQFNGAQRTDCAACRASRAEAKQSPLRLSPSPLANRRSLAGKAEPPTPTPLALALPHAQSDAGSQTRTDLRPPLSPDPVNSNSVVSAGGFGITLRPSNGSPNQAILARKLETVAEDVH